MAANNPNPNRSMPSNGTNIRRNLFSAHLSRRPNSSSTTTSATTLHVPADDANDDVVVRDQNGKIEILVPDVQQLPPDEEKEEREAENRLIEAYRQAQQARESNEMKHALDAKLQAAVASLDDDKWMFEGDDTPSV